MYCRGVITAEIIRGVGRAGGRQLLYSKEECWERPNLSPCTVGSWNKRTDWKSLPPTRCFLIPLFGFCVPPLAWLGFYILTHLVAEHPEWEMETLMPTGVYASSPGILGIPFRIVFLWNHMLNPDVERSESTCRTLKKIILLDQLNWIVSIGNTLLN